jgi:hypothetical protein
MPFYVKRVEEGDPSGVLEVFLPTAVLKARRNNGQWYVETNHTGAVNALRDNGWRKANDKRQAQLQGPQSSPKPKAAAPKAKPPVKKAQPKPKPKPKAKPKAATPPVELSLLDSSVKVIEKLLRSGDYDAYLQPLLDAENAGKTRKSVVTLLEDRLSK